jgi:hypothetical protein
MTSRSTPPQAASEVHAPAAHQARIDADMDDFEALIRSIHAAYIAGTTVSALRAHLEPIIASEDAGPLLGLDPQPPPTTEKAGQNTGGAADLDDQPCYAPLLGTSNSQSIENARGSSKKRSPESICYPKLLRESTPASGRISRKTVHAEERDCRFTRNAPTESVDRADTRSFAVSYAKPS